MRSAGNAGLTDWNALKSVDQHRGEDDQPDGGSDLDEDHGIAGAVAGDLQRGAREGTPFKASRDVACATGAAPAARRRPRPRRRSRSARPAAAGDRSRCARPAPGSTAARAEARMRSSAIAETAAERAACQREQRVFGEQLPRHARARGAQRAAHAQLSVRARCRAPAACDATFTQASSSTINRGPEGERRTAAGARDTACRPKRDRAEGPPGRLDLSSRRARRRRPASRRRDGAARTPRQSAACRIDARPSGIHRSASTPTNR